MEAFNIPPEWLYGLALFFGITITLAVLVFLWVIWRVKRINIPADADFFTTLRATPFSVVLLLDLLDLAFDFLSAPIAWALLSWLGLKSLRNISVAESVIPGTQFLPTMTVAWVIARFRR
jgi:hypothetical protein